MNHCHEQGNPSQHVLSFYVFGALFGLLKEAHVECYEMLTP
jgi:hypothetical protein